MAVGGIRCRRRLVAALLPLTVELVSVAMQSKDAAAFAALLPLTVELVRVASTGDDAAAVALALLPLTVELVRWRRSRCRCRRQLPALLPLTVELVSVAVPASTPPPCGRAVAADSRVDEVGRVGADPAAVGAQDVAADRRADERKCPANRIAPLRHAAGQGQAVERQRGPRE